MPRAFVFVGGGSGGHLYPALAIIEQIRVYDPDARVHIVCSNKAIDAQILSGSGVDFTPIGAKPPSIHPAAALRFARAWFPSLRAVRRVIAAHKASGDSVHVVSLGGYVAAPGSIAAKNERCDVTLINLDAVPGKANAWIASRAARAITAADVEGHPDWTRVRPVVRRALLEPRDPRDARASLGLDPDTRTLLITGGSQGAKSINRFVQRFAVEHPDLLSDWQILHQCGAGADPALIASTYEHIGIQSIVRPYLDDMGAALAASNLTLARCGAGNVAECWATQTPALFMPYPFHKDEHQRRNARVLEDAGAAIVCEDLVDPALNLERVGSELRTLLLDPERLGPMRDALSSMDAPDGADAIARVLVS